MTERMLICYGTRYGTTTSIVEEIKDTAQGLSVQVDVFNLEEDQPTDDISAYDLVVIGSGIQAGRWTKEPLRFIEDNLDALSTTKTALFVVCGDAGDPDRCEIAQEEYLDKIALSYPGLNPISTGLFGGLFDFSKYNRVVGFLVKRIVKSRQESDEEVPERIDFRDWDQIRNWTRSILEH
ncbi:nitric oxide synthase [Candidatus Thorarchaeota archaeon]|nr:MAG: nitric oxide synthase [Candidatus Thorarchaeota archaeon]